MDNILNQEKINEQEKRNQGSNCSEGTYHKGNCKTLIVHGTKYKTLFTNKYENRKKWYKPNEKHILSFIPGTINEVFIRNGEKVKKGQPLLVMEAMKMENTIFSPHDGTIKLVQVKEHDKVPKGVLMIEFE